MKWRRWTRPVPGDAWGRLGTPGELDSHGDVVEEHTPMDTETEELEAIFEMVSGEVAPSSAIRIDENKMDVDG
jgi:hypothetical protein